jgi:predicted PurR-regulated permease PerM
LPNGPFSSGDLPRSILEVLFVLALIFFSGWIVLPFLSATLWATTIVISTWSLLIRLQSRLGGRRGLATTVMTIALLLVLVIPLSLAIGELAGNMDTIGAHTNVLQTFQVSPPPHWVVDIPFKGPTLYAEWQRAADAGPGGLSPLVAPYAGPALRWFAARMGSLGGMILQFLLTVIASAILYMNGETAARGIRAFAQRLAGPHGDRAAVLAAGTIRGVAMGVIVTALVQTVIASAGLALASIRGAGVLAALILVLCFAQIGPFLVMAPVLIWKFYSGDSIAGFVLLPFTVVACTIDSFIRPLLIRKGADLPLLIIFAGVIGGMIGFGIMGIFIGPVILAVTYVLLREWIELRKEQVDGQSLPRVVGAGNSVQMDSCD